MSAWFRVFLRLRRYRSLHVTNPLYPLLSSTVPTPSIHTTDVVVINYWAYSRAKDSSSPMLSIIRLCVRLSPSPPLTFPSLLSPPPSLPSPPSFLPFPPSRPNRSVRLPGGLWPPTIWYICRISSVRDLRNQSRQIYV